MWEYKTYWFDPTTENWDHVMALHGRMAWEAWAVENSDTTNQKKIHFKCKIPHLDP